MCVHVCGVCIYVHVFACVRLCVYVYACACVHVSMRVDVCVCINACTCVQTLFAIPPDIAATINQVAEKKKESQTLRKVRLENQTVVVKVILEVIKQSWVVKVRLEVIKIRLITLSL